MLIKEIKAEETWQVRRNVLWPGKSLEYVKLDEDKFGRHYGLFVDAKLTSVISVFIDGNKAQFRKFATAVKEQGKGYGTILLEFVMKKAIDLRVNTIWCNARKDKTSFYKRFDMKETEKEFIKEQVEYVIMYKRL